MDTTGVVSGFGDAKVERGCRMRAALKIVCCWTVFAICVAPSVAANVWPRLTHIRTEGAANGTEVGITIAVTLSALGMAAVPFAMRNADTLLFRLTCLLTALGLATFNYSMAVDLVTRWRDESPAAVKQLTAAALERRITDATAAKAKLPQLPHTTAAMVTAAKAAVDLATQARTQECGTVGDNCRMRVVDLTKAMADLRAAETNRANTVKLERLDGEIRTASKEKLDLGPIPSDTNPGAARIGKLLAIFVDMGSRPDLVVTDWWPTGVAIVIEWIGLALPRIILTAIGIVERRPGRLRALLALVVDRWQTSAPPLEGMQRLTAPVAATSAAAAVGPSAATTAMPKIPTPIELAAVAKPIKPASVAGNESVRQWFNARAVVRAGGRVKPKAEAYEGSYVPWCEGQGIMPVSFTRFGTMIKAPVAEGGCGVELERSPAKRDFYVGIALVSPPRLVGRNGKAP